MTVEIWGGHECTVNRVGDAYRDQTKLTGHDDRLDDLDHFAGLGLRRLRFPLLWERIATADGGYDWHWADICMARLRDLGIDPIIGLLHHGSGPRDTNLLDEDFPAKFANYAAAVAARYPYVQDWTPINEPLTTARFSALYGHWYPHAQDDASFWRALLNQIDATRLTMRAIRSINPQARLIQTDDLGRTYATETLRAIADHHNARRWMGWDLLSGRVTPGHFFWEELCRLGHRERLLAIADDPCPPDIFGINHYITSDRYLDDRSNGGTLPAIGYCDEAAARCMTEVIDSLGVAITECWSRYGLPIAVTECHLSCTREEQLRWFAGAAATCTRLAAQGIDVRAITAWALLGAYDWDNLLTKSAGHYQPGAFDISGRTLRLTALGTLIRDLATGGDATNEFAGHSAGWWQRDIRHGGNCTALRPLSDVRPILITGATGTLGQALAGACRLRGLSHVLTDRGELAIDDPASVERALDIHRPSLIINAAGWVRVDDAEAQEQACHAANTAGPLRLAAAAARRGIRTIQFSSDLVFGGPRDALWSEQDPPHPLNVYGHSKYAMETALLDCHPETLIVRTAAFFSPYDDQNFARAVERSLGAGEPFVAAAAQIVCPTYVPDLVNAVLDLAIDGEAGIWHLTNGHPVSWEAFARMVARALHLPEALIVGDFGDDRPARRPSYAALGSARGALMPPLADAIARYAAVRIPDLSRAQ